MIATRTAFYTAGGTLPYDAPSYVERTCSLAALVALDRDLLTALRQGEYCYVLNARRGTRAAGRGKSSLCVHAIARLRQEGVRTAFLDLTKFGGRNLSPEQWYAALLAEIGRELGLRAECLQYWKEHPELPPVQRLFGAIRADRWLHAALRQKPGGLGDAPLDWEERMLFQRFRREAIEVLKQTAGRAQ